MITRLLYPPTWFLNFDLLAGYVILIGGSAGNRRLPVTEYIVAVIT